MIDEKNPFGCNPADMTSVYIDGPNLYSTFRDIEPEFNVDYGKLRAFFDENSRLHGITYYASLNPTQEFDPVKRLSDWCANNGYTTFLRDQRIVNDEFGMKLKDKINVKLAIDAVTAARAGHSSIYLFASDGELSEIIDPIREAGAKLTVISTRKVVANVLRRDIHAFIDLLDLAPLIRDTRYADRNRDRIAAGLDPIGPSRAPRRTGKLHPAGEG